MNSKYHFLVSSVIGVIFTIFYSDPTLFLIAVSSGVFIDIDHVILACIRHRTVKPVWYTFECLTQLQLTAIFERYPIYGVKYLISLHIIETIILGIITINLFTTQTHMVLMLTLGVHIGMDILDVRYTTG